MNDPLFEVEHLSLETPRRFLQAISCTDAPLASLGTWRGAQAASLGVVDLGAVQHPRSPAARVRRTVGLTSHLQVLQPRAGSNRWTAARG